MPKRSCACSDPTRTLLHTELYGAAVRAVMRYSTVLVRALLVLGVEKARAVLYSVLVDPTRTVLRTVLGSAVRCGRTTCRLSIFMKSGLALVLNEPSPPYWG